ncbi:hypothetical protein ACFL59_09335 [Planctomycetota bacterium]
MRACLSVALRLMLVAAGLGIVALLLWGAQRIRRNGPRAPTRYDLASLKMAVLVYWEETGVYPGTASTCGTDRPDLLYRALTGSTAHDVLRAWPPRRVGVSQGRVSQALAGDHTLADPVPLKGEEGSSPVFLDIWGCPYHYVGWNGHAHLASGDDGAPLARPGDAPFGLWSNGPNRVNEWGRGDDITSWSVK